MQDRVERCKQPELLVQTRNNEALKVLLLIESGAFAYSLLHHWEQRLYFPVAVVVDSPEMMDEIAGKMGIFNTRAISSNMPTAKFRKAIASYHDDVCIVSYNAGRYSNENMEDLRSLIRSGGYDEMEMNMPVVIVFQRVIPEIYADLFSLVIELLYTNLQEIDRLMIEHYLESLKAFILENHQILAYQIRHMHTENQNRDGRFWAAVMQMVGMAFEDKIEDISAFFFDAVQNAYDLACSYEFAQQIPEVFRQALDESIPDICRFVPEKEAVALSRQELKEFVLYDAEFYYMPEEVFNRVCGSL